MAQTAERALASCARGRGWYDTLRNSSTMRGALMDATLPVVMRRTCVCPSRLLPAAVKCVGMCRRKFTEYAGVIRAYPDIPDRTNFHPLTHGSKLR